MLDHLQAKLEDIRQRKEQALANLHAIQGAEQVILELMQEEANKLKEEQKTE